MLNQKEYCEQCRIPLREWEWCGRGFCEVCEDKMIKTNKQLETVLFIIKSGMTKMDNECVKSIETIHEFARSNYAISIWAGVVGRHASAIAEHTEGEVVIKTAKQREQLAEMIIRITL